MGQCPRPLLRTTFWGERFNHQTPPEEKKKDHPKTNQIKTNKKPKNSQPWPPKKLFEPCGLFLALPPSPIFIRNAGMSPWPTRSSSCACWCSCHWAWCCPTAVAIETRASWVASRVAPSSLPSPIFSQLCLLLASSGPSHLLNQKRKRSWSPVR